MDSNSTENRDPKALAEAQQKQADAKAAEAKTQAENKLAQQKLQHDAKTAALQAKREKAGEAHFVRDGKVYIPAMPSVLIPGLGIRTALEICTDTKAQEYLIKEGCIGSVIEEVL